MRPPETIVRAMGVSDIVTLIVMVPMGRNPFDRITLNCKNSPHGEKALEPFVCFETFMGELSMVRHGNSEAIEKIAKSEKFQHTCALCERSC